MNTRVKLALDILMGTLVPVLILSNFNEIFGATFAYVVASLIPVVWVLADLFFITKRFNFITTYVGASAIVSGGLAFWYVDGIYFAVKDSVGSLIAVVVFGFSLLFGRPMFFHFFFQALRPTTDKQIQHVKDLCDEPDVAKALFGGTLLMFGINVIATIANFMLNLTMVIAEFGTPLFNRQVGEVNAITRLVLSIPATVALMASFAWVRWTMSEALPEERDAEEDPWDLLDRRYGRDTGRAFTGRVIVIGAGAAGLAAAYFLERAGIDFTVFEAGSTVGGRMKKADGFADFPVSLGAEWLATDRSIFTKILDDPAIVIDVETVRYRPGDVAAVWEDDRLKMDTVDLSLNYEKFVNGSWFDFFDRYIVPRVEKNIVFDSPVSAVNYHGDGICVATPTGNARADKVIATVPLVMLQNESIVFSPPLPAKKRRAINRVKMWTGIKVLLEFSEKFYPSFVDVAAHPETAGHITYFDVAYGQNSERNILGLIAIGEAADRYLARSGDELKQHILDELEQMFPYKARKFYIRHVVQDWAVEPYIESAYVRDHENWRHLPILAEPVSDKVYFAGEAYTSGDSWGNVHDAAISAKRAVRQLSR